MDIQENVENMLEEELKKKGDSHVDNEDDTIDVVFDDAEDEPPAKSAPPPTKVNKARKPVSRTNTKKTSKKEDVKSKKKKDVVEDVVEDVAENVSEDIKPQTNPQIKPQTKPQTKKTVDNVDNSDSNVDHHVDHHVDHNEPSKSDKSDHNSDHHVDHNEPSKSDKSDNVDDNAPPKPESTNEPNKDDTLYAYITKHKNIPLFDRIAGMIYGCALGDCLGFPIEGKSKEDMDYYYPEGIKDLIPKDNRGIIAGDWSDDTDLLILFMDLLSSSELEFSALDYAKKLKYWKQNGFKELEDLAGMGVEQLTAHVVSKDNFLKDPLAAAMLAYREMAGKCTNGAITRGTIAAISKNWQKYSIHHCILTHPDPRCIYSCWLVTAVCRHLLKENIPSLETLFKNKVAFIKKKVHAQEFNSYKKIYEGDLSQLLKKLDLNTGNINHTLKTLGCAFYALRNLEKVENHEDYKRIQLEIVNFGGDTDTNAAVSGQVLGSHLGYCKLPMDWIGKLKHKKWLDSKILKLFKSIEKL